MTIVSSEFERILRREIQGFEPDGSDGSGPEKQQDQVYRCADYAVRAATVALEESGLGGRTEWEIGRRAEAMRALPRVVDHETAAAAIACLGACKASLAKRLGINFESKETKLPVARAVFCASEAVRLARDADPAYVVDRGELGASWRERLGAAAAWAAIAGCIVFTEMSTRVAPDPRVLLREISTL
jgi:hypothetical protein